MSKSIIVFAVAIALLGCKPSQDGAPAARDNQSAPSIASPKVALVTEVADWVQHHAATVLDANGPETRQAMGVVPGAVLLSSSRDYALSELPQSKDGKLVFYCGGEMCRASDSAAARAVQAGYSDVNVMRAGIRGWKSAGQTTQIPRS